MAGRKARNRFRPWYPWGATSKLPSGDEIHTAWWVGRHHGADRWVNDTPGRASVEKKGSPRATRVLPVGKMRRNRRKASGVASKGMCAGSARSDSSWQWSEKGSVMRMPSRDPRASCGQAASGRCWVWNQPHPSTSGPTNHGSIRMRSPLVSRSQLWSGLTRVNFMVCACKSAEFRLPKIRLLESKSQSRHKIL